MFHLSSATINEKEFSPESMERFRAAIAAEGLLLLGVTALEESGRMAVFKDWLSRGWHAGMKFMEEYQDLRGRPAEILPHACRAVVLALPYGQGEKYYPRHDPPKPRIAQYARLKDYHKVLKTKGARLVKELHRLGQEVGFDVAETRVFVDTAPIFERELASKTRRGFVGKNTLYIHPEYGSFLLLAEIFTSLPLPIDDSARVDHTRRTEDGGCGGCKRCQVHCPTGALDEAFRLNANRCLAYWTIEHRGTIPEEFWPWLRDFYFGCDICQLVCPYNRGTDGHHSDVATLGDLDLYLVATMSQEFYEKTFGGTPLTRAKRQGLRRNALIAMAVTGDRRLDDALHVINDDDHEVLIATRKQIKAWLIKMSKVT